MLMVIQPQTTRTPKFHKSCFHLRRIAQLHFILHGVAGLVQIGLHVTDIVRRSWIPSMHSWNIKGELDMKGSIHRIFQGTLQIKSLSRTVTWTTGIGFESSKISRNTSTIAMVPSTGTRETQFKGRRGTTRRNIETSLHQDLSKDSGHQVIVASSGRDHSHSSGACSTTATSLQPSEFARNKIEPSRKMMGIMVSLAGCQILGPHVKIHLSC